MKFKGIYLIVFACVVFSCTSNTIYEKPEDLIAKDTMVMLLKDLYLANAAKNVKNKQAQRRFSYVPIVYAKYKIDSSRFQRSNLYYTSRIDIYEPLLGQVLDSLELERKDFARKKHVRDSLRQDSLKRVRKKQVKRNLKVLDIEPDTEKKKIDLSKSKKS